MENSRKQNLCQPTGREEKLTNAVMTLVGQETDFQAKFHLGQLNHQESSHIKICYHGSRGMLILCGRHWHLRIKRKEEGNSRFCYYLQEK